MLPPVLRRRVGLNGFAFLNRSEGKKVPRDEMRIGERYSSRLHPGPFLFRDLILRRSAAITSFFTQEYEWLTADKREI